MRIEDALRAVVAALVASCLLVPSSLVPTPRATRGLTHGDVRVSPPVREHSRAASTGDRWLWPVRPVQLVRGFEAPATAYSPGHRGIDLRATVGTPVLSPASGTVRFAGVVVDRPVLTIDHGAGVLSSYEPIGSELEAGDMVAPGAILGAVASGGHCADSCLHVGVRIDGEYVSPLLFFARVPRAVLLPLHPRTLAPARRSDRRRCTMRQRTA
ncbi:M23 family metallopeptidase [Leifsonia poae]|uniref:M23 family metallopeptidase n=1 Tax=Leifsonia poae TaxID=110933 RepID=UPI001CBDE2D3|nr:M23 family metallopeptidase [Leifsonia poae]